MVNMELADHNQARLLQCILDSMGDGVVVADQTGKFILFNPSAEKILGVGAVDTTPEQWSTEYGCFLPDGITPHPPSELPLARAIRGETVAGARLFVRHAGKPEGVWLNITARPLREEHDTVRGGVAVVRDITDIKRAEDALQVARRDAESANYAKSEFLSRMSHELRTPLNAILGFAQLLEIDDLQTRQRESVEQILKGGRHLLTLINEVLDIARIEAGKLSISPEPILVDEAFDSAIALIEPLAVECEITVSVQPSVDANTYVLADRQRLQQVLLNLLSNAIKYNRKGGGVTVACVTTDTERRRLTVTDTGIGIAQEKLSLLFSPFERLGAAQSGIEGSGIGLALSKRLVEAMGGTIGVDSGTGRGSTFWVELPLGENPVETYSRGSRKERGESPAAPTASPAMTVLYIEDNPPNSLLMERILENRPAIRLISAMQGRLGLERRDNIVLT